MMWDLSPLVKSTRPSDVAADLEKEVRRSQDFRDRYKGRSGGKGAPQIREILEGLDSLELEREGLFLFCKLKHCEDPTDPDHERIYASSIDASNRICQNLAFADIKLVDMIRSRMELVDDPGLMDFKHVLERRMLKARYALSEERERLILATESTGIEAWAKKHDDWLNSLVFKLDLEDGVRELSLGEIFAYRSHPDRDTRRRAFRSIGFEISQKRTIPCDALMAICRDHITNMTRRGHPSPLTSSAIDNDVEEGAIVDLVDLIMRNVDLARRFSKTKARMLGVDRMGNWDIFSPPPCNNEDRYPWQRSREIIRSAFAAFDPELPMIVDRMFDNGRIDAEMRKGKQVGGFCEDWLGGRTSFIQWNYGGSIDDVIGLAHELGHAVHTHHYSRMQRPCNCHVSPCIAEMMSTMAELLVAEELIRRASDEEERKARLALMLDGFVFSVFHVAVRYLFERSLYEKIGVGDRLDSEDICRPYSKARDDIFGDSICWDKESRWDWAWGDYFIPRQRFCNYPYMFAHLLVFASYGRYKERGSDFTSRFKAMLSAGSSRSVEDLVSMLGMDATRNIPWESGFTQAGVFLDRLEDG